MDLISSTKPECFESVDSEHFFSKLIEQEKYKNQGNKNFEEIEHDDF